MDTNWYAFIERQAKQLSIVLSNFISVSDQAAQAINLKVPATKRPDQSLGRKRERLTKEDKQPIGALINYDLAGRVHESGDYGVSLSHEVRVGLGPSTFITTGQINHSPDKGTVYSRGLTTVNYDHLKTGVVCKWAM